jgi:hypothetical protein
VHENAADCKIFPNCLSACPNFPAIFVDQLQLRILQARLPGSVQESPIIAMDSKDKSDVVKKLALDGKFNDVEERYGTKARTKAIQYAEGKLTYLKEVAATGASIETDKCATEFMLYAVKSNGSVEEASLAFLDTKCNEKNQQVLPVRFFFFVSILFLIPK